MLVSLLSVTLAMAQPPAPQTSNPESRATPDFTARLVDTDFVFGIADDRTVWIQAGPNTYCVRRARLETPACFQRLDRRVSLTAEEFQELLDAVRDQRETARPDGG